VFFEHDSRDNFFTASSGWNCYLESMFYSPDFGSDRKYELYRANAVGYTPLGEQFVLGGRVDARASRGDVPFYQLPYLDMRGIPVARYQDENVALVEAELRWNVTPRWALLAFAGTGRTWGTSEHFDDGDSASAWGGGFRRLVARRLGLYMGIDVAIGPEETAFYIQAGSAWR
jgi:hemolysin activation/secretion protein